MVTTWHVPGLLAGLGWSVLCTSNIHQPAFCKIWVQIDVLQQFSSFIINIFFIIFFIILLILKIT